MLSHRQINLPSLNPTASWAAAAVLFLPALSSAQETVVEEAAPAIEEAAEIITQQVEEASAPVDAAQAVPSMGEIRVGGDQLSRAAAVLGQDIQPSDMVIPEADLRRAVVYQYGNTELESRKLDIFIAEEIRRQVDAGADPAKFEIEQSEIDAAINQTIDSIKTEYSSLDPSAVLRHNNIDPDNLAAATRQKKLFDMVFLPDDPREWPPTTVEGLKSKMTEGFVQQLIDQRNAQDEAAAEAGEGAEEVDAAKAEQSQQLFKVLMSQQLRGVLNESADIEYASGGLPEGVAMRVNGTDIMTDDVYGAVASGLSDQELSAVRRWTLKTALIERALSEAGQMMDPETATAAYTAHVKPPEEPQLFPFENIVRMFKRFPSMEAYREYYTLLESFRRMIEPEIDDAALEQYMTERGNGLLNLARVDAEIILLSAYDFENATWKEGGWDEAAERALSVVDQLVASEGENWDELLEANSDFWDPPSAATQQPMGGPQVKKNKGRFGPKYRNELLRDLGESDYSLFLDGSAVTDEIFFNLEPGEVGGPWKGPHGYYIARIVSKTPPTRSMSIKDENIRKMATEDYVAMRFNAFARDVHEAAVPGE